MRRDVSLLLANGHAEADRYPFWQLQLETLLVTQRLNSLLASESALIQHAISACFDKPALQAFQRHLDRLDPR